MDCSYLVKQASCKSVVLRGLAQIPIIQEKSTASLEVFHRSLLNDLEKYAKIFTRPSMNDEKRNT